MSEAHQKSESMADKIKVALQRLRDKDTATNQTGTEDKQQAEQTEDTSPIEKAEDGRRLRRKAETYTMGQVIDIRNRETSQAETRKQELQVQIEELEETINTVSQNPSQYLVTDPETGEQRRLVGNDITRMKEQVSQLRESQNRLTTYQGEIRDYAADYISAIAEQADERIEYTKRLNETGNRPFVDESGQRYSYTEAGSLASQIEKAPRENQIGDVVIQGIPGPGAGPKPGTFAAKISETISPPVKNVLIQADEGFKNISDNLRKGSDELAAKSVENADWKGFGTYLASTALRVDAAAFDVATFEFRPQLWIDTGVSLGTLATVPEAQLQFASKVASDPFGFTAELAGGALLGGYAKTKAGQFTEPFFEEAKFAYKVLEAQKGSKTQGIYGESVKPSSYGDFFKEYRYARQVRKTPVQEWELGIETFPPETETITTTRLFERRSVDIKTGTPSPDYPFFEDKAYYYSPVEPVKPGSERAFVEVYGDEWTPTQITGQSETVLPYELGGEGGFVKVEGYRRGGMKPFKEPDLTLEPRNDPVTTIGKGSGGDTPARVLIKKGSEALKENKVYNFPDIEVTQVPLYENMDVLSFGKVKAPGSTVKMGNIGVLGLGSFDFNVEKTAPTLEIKGLEKNKPPSKLTKQFTPSLPKLGDFTIPNIATIQLDKQTQKQKQIPIVTPTFSLDQIQVQEPDYPDLPKVNIVTGDSSWNIKPVRPRKNKKKRGKKRSKKGVAELRVDKAFALPEFKEPKIKEFKL